jgi:hypothetical protein
MFGLLGAPASSSLQKLGILYRGTLTWVVGVRWCGVFFGSGHGKGPHDGARTLIKCFIWHEQLNAHGAKL